MKKFAILAAVAAVSAIALPASAAQLVRVSLKGKSAEQINADIKIAAETVCKAANGVSNRADYTACVGYAVRSAKAQLEAANVSSGRDA